MSSSIPVSEFQDFVYRVSHDLSAPLRAVIEFSKLLQEGHADKLDSEGMLYLRMIQQGGEKMRSMMDGLLALSRLGSNVPLPELVKLDAVIEQCSQQMAAAQQLQGFDVRVSGLPDIKADPVYIRTLFEILLDNAFRYVSAGIEPKVMVGAEQRDGEMVFSVTDNGIGIDPQYHDDIFTIFRRLHADSEYPGLGIGLTLAKKIVGIYGGRLWVESVEGQGASFCFTLPKAM